MNMNRKALCLSFLMLVAGGVSAAETATTTPEQQWQQHFMEMQQIHRDWLAGKTPEERQKLMEQHWQSMGRGMQAMGGCMGAGHGMGMGQGMGQGMGGMGGAWMSMDTVEQVDQRIQHMEQMIEQLRAHREMLTKPKQ